MTFTLEPGTTAESLRELCAGFVTMPEDPGYDAARVPWNVAIDQRPAAVAAPETVEQIARTVRAARALGLRVSVQGTGHGAGALGGRPLDDVVLIRTSNLRGVYVDLGRSVARVECGAWWQDVVDAAAPHGLAALHGSSPDVGVVGYSLGGGLSWYARKRGLACNSIVAVELVTAQGEIVRVDAESDPDLFWAIRGEAGASASSRPSSSSSSRCARCSRACSCGTSSTPSESCAPGRSGVPPHRRRPPPRCG